MKKLIGIFGGTFNPIHLGHLHVASELMKKLPLTEIRFLPCHTPVHRETPTCSIQDRVNMIELALAKYPHFNLDMHEINRQGPSFMIDTLREIKMENPDSILVLIIGIDAYATLNSWKNWQHLTDYCHLIVVNRPGYLADTDAHMSKHTRATLITDPQDLLASPCGHILHVTIEPSSVSATDLRNAHKLGKSLANKVPESIWNYIKEHNLYQ